MDEPDSLSIEPSPTAPLHAAAPLGVLTYRQAEGGHASRRSSLFMYLMLPALAIPFLPMLGPMSPAEVLYDVVFGASRSFMELRWVMAGLTAPFLLAFPLIFWKCRLMVTAPTSRGLRLALWCIGGVLSMPMFGIIIYAMQVVHDRGYQPDMWAVPAGFIAMAGFWGVAGYLAYCRRREDATTLALYAGFFGNAVLCIGLGLPGLRWGQIVAIYLLIIMIIDMIGALTVSRSPDRA